MARELCIPERTSKLIVGLLLLLGGIAMVVIGLTILPVVGLVLAVVPLALAYWFFTRPLNESCEM